MMMKKEHLTILFVIALLAVSCKNNTSTSKDDSVNNKKTDPHSCMNVPKRFGVNEIDSNMKVMDMGIQGMVLIPGGTFEMGGDNDQAGPDEYPKHQVYVDSFYMDATEVTNAQFKKFVDATGYVTTAEKAPDWEELKKELPPGTPKPPDSVLVAASLVFKQSRQEVNLNDYGQWWEWKAGANWKHPQGPGSNIIGKDNYPVVHVSWFDANAYCKWAGKRLPTEAEWEHAARGGLVNNIYPWGNEPLDKGQVKANTWEGKFPYLNTRKDGYVTSAPVRQYQPNGYGLYDMSGNVWEWCSDWYHSDYYNMLGKSVAKNPKGPSKSYDPEEPYISKKTIRGGSFLCNESYCTGYRNARRMKSSPDTGLEHTGFRCVRDFKK